MKKSSNQVFLDSNFIISLQVTKHQFFGRAQELIYQFKQDGESPVVIPLVFDEFWYILKGYLKTDFLHDTKEDLIKKLVKATKNVLATDGLQIKDVALAEEDLINTLKIMAKYDLRPRDALIVKSMKVLGVNKIATFDSDFDRVKGIIVIK